MVRGRVCTIRPLVTIEWREGFSMSFIRETPVDEILLDGLRAMWYGGVQVSQVRGRVFTRFK